MSTFFVCVNAHQVEGHKILSPNAKGGNVTAEFLVVFVPISWNGCSFHSTQFPVHTNNSASGGHEPSLKTRYFCMNVAEAQNFAHAGTKSCMLWVLLNRAVKFKSLQQRHEVTQKCRKYANISIILQAGSVVLTMFLQEKCLFVLEFELHRVQPDWFALYEMKNRKWLPGCTTQTSATQAVLVQNCICTKWQGLWPFLRNFQTLCFCFIFKFCKLDYKLTYESAVIFFFTPSVLIVSVLLLYLMSPLKLVRLCVCKSMCWVAGQ